MGEVVSNIFETFKAKRFDLTDEKRLQGEIFLALQSRIQSDTVQKEYTLDDKNRIDFLIGSVGIEVKIKGSKRDIYKQCERYCGFDTIKELVLVTNKSMGLPGKINGKDCFIIKLGMAWL